MSRWMGVLCLLVGAGVMLVFVVNLRGVERAYAERGALARVESSDIHYSESRTRAGSRGRTGRTTVTFATATYLDKNGTERGLTSAVDAELARKLHRKQRVYVQYVPGEPELVRFEGEGAATWLAFAMMLCVFSALAWHVARAPAVAPGQPAEPPPGVVGNWFTRALLAGGGGLGIAHGVAPDGAGFSAAFGVLCLAAVVISIVPSLHSRERPAWAR